MNRHRYEDTPENKRYRRAVFGPRTGKTTTAVRDDLAAGLHLDRVGRLQDEVERYAERLTTRRRVKPAQVAAELRTLIHAARYL